MRLYLFAWSTACAVALAMLGVGWRRFSLWSTAYWRFLGAPWKLITFSLATLGITLIVPYTGDPTWDYVDALFMSVLAFTTAPWAVGVVYRTLRGRERRAETYVAVCMWLFAASWSYDLYLLLRDGYYPVTWWANLVASSVLYLAAGLFWNLAWTSARGAFFAFTEAAWPDASLPTTAPFSRVMVPALCVMLLVGLMILAFATGWRWR